MRHDPIDPALFIEHRQQVAARLPPNSIAIVHAADPLTTNGDGAVRYVPAADLVVREGLLPIPHQCGDVVYWDVRD